MINAEQVGLLMKSQPVGMHLNGQWAIPRTRNVEILEIEEVIVRRTAHLVFAGSGKADRLTPTGDYRQSDSSRVESVSHHSACNFRIQGCALSAPHLFFSINGHKNLLHIALEHSVPGVSNC
jgi:hypothetical protein